MSWCKDRGKVFLDFVEKSNRCAEQSELSAHFGKSLCDLGIDGYIYSLVRNSFLPSDKIVHGVTFSYPDAWVKHYHENNYTSSDPTYRKILKSNGLFTWDSLPRVMKYSKRDQQMMDEAKEFGLKKGLSISLHGPYGEVTGLGFFGRFLDTDFHKNDMSVLYALANQYHLNYTNLDKSSQSKIPIDPSRLCLSDRQRTILQWAALGKGSSVIGEILGVSEDTVNDHLRAIYKKLGCNDRILAIVKAINMGLIAI